MPRIMITSAFVAGLLLSSVSPALAQGVIRFEGTDVVEDALNPCTGEFEDVNFSATVTIYQRDNLLMFHAVGTAQQGDYTGPVVTRFTDTLNGDTAVSTFNSNVTMRNGSGEAIKAHFVFHTTWSGGEPVADVVLVSLRCVGS